MPSFLRLCTVLACLVAASPARAGLLVGGPGLFDLASAAAAVPALVADDFGSAVAVNGDRAVVGAASQAFAFVWTGTTWAYDGELVPSGPSGVSFGSAVAVEGDRAVVGDPTSNGSVYVFVRGAGGWTTETRLFSSDPVLSGRFGLSVSISGDRILVGTQGEDRAYVFARSGATWSEEEVLTIASPGTTQFGYSVSISGDRALVGERVADAVGLSSGAAHVYLRVGADWVYEAQLSPTTTEYRVLGTSVSLSGDVAVVGAVSSAQTGAPPEKAFVFARVGGAWVEEAELLSDDPNATDLYGLSVSVSGDRVVVGASRDNDGGANAGAAYVYARHGGAWDLEEKLAPEVDPDFGAGSRAGWAVSVSGDRLVIGARGEFQVPDGAAYGYDRVGAVWPLRARLVEGSVAPFTSAVVDGPGGLYYFGPPADGVTVDDLAVQNLVRGVPGYYDHVANASLATEYDPVAPAWLDSDGTGEVLELGRAFRWRLYDRAFGNPTISQSVELPFVLSTPLPPNTADVALDLDTRGSRFNHLANPFPDSLVLSGIASWPGAWNLVPDVVQVYDPVAQAWVDAPAAIGPWEAFRVRSKGPRVGNRPRTLTIPASAAGLSPASAVSPGVAASAVAEATDVVLRPVAPNPSSGGARVAFAVPDAGPVRLSVVDVRGREVAVLVDDERSVGTHEARLGHGLAPGVYVVRLEAAGQVLTQRAVVAR